MSLLLALTGSGLNALRFNAAADTFTMPSAAVPSGSGAWTVATWVRLVNDRNDVTTIWSLDGLFSSSWHSLQCDSSGTSLRLYETGTTVTTIATLTVGTWYYVVVRKSAGGTIKTYIGDEAGGALTTGSGSVTNITYSGDGYVGGNAYSEFLDGRMWGMRVWDAELSDAEVDAEFTASTAARTSNLRAQWLLDNLTVPGDDTSGNNRDLTNAGGSWTLEAGPVLPAAPASFTGTLARTLANDTLAASGTLDSTGSLARTLADVTLSAAGTLVYSGTLARTLADATLSASGALTFSGTLARTLADATLAASGTLEYSGTVARTLGDVTSTASGLFSAPITGTLARTLADDTLSASGTLVYSGTLAQTLADATLVASGALVYSGTLARTLADATLAASGNLAYSGTLARTLSDATLAASGLFSAPITGTLARTLANDTLAASGTLDSSGSLARTLADATLSASGALVYSGTLARTLADATLSASGTLIYSGTLARTLVDATLSSSGTVINPVTGTLARTLANATLVASGTLDSTGSLARTLANATLSASGALVYSGTVARTLANATLNASGTLDSTGTLARTLADATLNAAGTLDSTGSLARTLSNATLNASGISIDPITGSLARTLAGDTLSGVGFFGQGYNGTLNVTLGGVQSFTTGDSLEPYRPFSSVQAFIQPMNIPTDVSNTIVLGIHQSDVIIRSAIITALADMRANPWVLDRVFASLVQDSLTAKDKGQRELQAAKNWFLRTNIPVLVTPVMDEFKTPCISITLVDSSEVPSEATTSDTHYEPFEYDDSTSPALTTGFTPQSYNPLTGEITLAPDALPPGVYVGPGMLIVDKYGTAHEILRMGDSTDQFYIAANVQANFNGAVLKGIRPSIITSVESSSFKETYRIGLHVGAEPAYLIWLHSIVVFALLRYKEVLLEGRGFERSTFSSNDLSRDTVFETENIFTRYLTISGHVRQYWPKIVSRPIDVVQGEFRVSGEDADVRLADTGEDPNEALWMGNLDSIDASKRK